MVFVANGVDLGHNTCSDGYRDRLRTTRVLWWLQRLANDQRGGFSVNLGSLRTQRVL